MVKHPFHLVDPRPGPILSSAGCLMLARGIGAWINNFDNKLLIGGMLLLSLSACLWGRDVGRESTFQGKHTRKVENGLRIGICLFIISEVCFFFSFFGAFFHSSLSAAVEIAFGPPAGIDSINPFEVPLLNTTVLLARGATITGAHMSIICRHRGEAHTRFACTVALGFFFLTLQFTEYNFRSFTISDSVYGRTFFVSTGFHGMHVLIGTLFILVMGVRHGYRHLSNIHHFGFEARVWYGHFVDVVGLFLYLCIYGGCF